MNHLLRSRVALLAFLACSAPLCALSLDELKGEWKVDGDATWKLLSEDPKFAALPDQQKAGMKEGFQKVNEKVRFTFDADGLTVAGIGDGDKAPASSFASTGEKTGTMIPEKKGTAVAFELTADGKLFATPQPDRPAMVLLLVPPPTESTAAPAK